MVTFYFLFYKKSIEVQNKQQNKYSFNEYIYCNYILI